MIEFLLGASAVTGTVTSALFALAGGLLVYGVSFKLLFRHPTDELHSAMTSLFRVIGMLVSLMLSLAFAEVFVKHHEVESAIQREGVAIADTFNNLRRFDEQGTREARRILIEYTRAIVDDDWPALAQDRVGERAAALRSALEERLWDLEPATKVQEQLWSQILSDIDLISDYRLIRLDTALAEPPIYLSLMALGFLLTMACFGIHQPFKPVIALLSLYAMFVGVVLYLILTLSDPYRGGFGVDPTTFEHMVEVMRARDTS